MNDALRLLQSYSFEDDNIDFIENISNFYCLELNESDRDVFRNEIFNRKLNLKTLSISEKICETCLNERNSNWIQYALLMHSIEDFRWDPRENFIYMSIINYVSNQLKNDIKKTIEHIVPYSSHVAVNNFVCFFNQDESLKNLRAMGLKAVKRKKIYSFEQIQPPWIR